MPFFINHQRSIYVSNNNNHITIPFRKEGWFPMINAELRKATSCSSMCISVRELLLEVTWEKRVTLHSAILFPD
jgi:hypothetical protein